MAWEYIPEDSFDASYWDDFDVYYEEKKQMVNKIHKLNFEAKERLRTLDSSGIKIQDEGGYYVGMDYIPVKEHPDFYDFADWYDEQFAKIILDFDGLEVFKFKINISDKAVALELLGEEIFVLRIST